MVQEIIVKRFIIAETCSMITLMQEKSAIKGKFSSFCTFEFLKSEFFSL
jgi:hypothetical protein